MQEPVSNDGDKIQVIKFLGPTAKWYSIFLAFSCVLFVYLLHTDHNFLCRYVASNRNVIDALSNTVPSVSKTLAEFSSLNSPYVDSCYIDVFYVYVCIAVYLIFLIYLFWLFRNFDRLSPDAVRHLLVWFVIVVGVLIIPPAIKSDRGGNLLILSFDKYGYFILQELVWLTMGGFAAALFIIDLALLARARMRSLA